jgi:hypothetical protein
LLSLYDSEQLKGTLRIPDRWENRTKPSVRKPSGFLNFVSTLIAGKTPKYSLTCVHWLTKTNLIIRIRQVRDTSIIIEGHSFFFSKNFSEIKLERHNYVILVVNKINICHKNVKQNGPLIDTIISYNYGILAWFSLYLTIRFFCVIQKVFDNKRNWKRSIRYRFVAYDL